ncbi:MAG: hypothetical protein N2491_07100 [Negativicutes bacterium]|nr:hypothetical protein [Negativicutes bacterium]
MARLRRIFHKSRQHTPLVPVTTIASPTSLMQVVNPVYLVLQVRPLVDYGMRELSATNPRHAMTETAIIAYLMGMGFEFRTARAIAESWEENETFFGEGERCRPKFFETVSEKTDD